MAKPTEKLSRLVELLDQVLQRSQAETLAECSTTSERVAAVSDAGLFEFPERIYFAAEAHESDGRADGKDVTDTLRDLFKGVGDLLTHVPDEMALAVRGGIEPGSVGPNGYLIAIPASKTSRVARWFARLLPMHWRMRWPAWMRLPRWRWLPYATAAVGGIVLAALAFMALIAWNTDAPDSTTEANRAVADQPETSASPEPPANDEPSPVAAPEPAATTVAVPNQTPETTPIEERFSIAMADGDAAMLRGDFDEAVRAYQRALAIVPDDPIAIALRTKAANQQACFPFAENFVGIVEGGLPPGWSGSNSIVVRRDGNASWLQSSAEDDHHVKTPPLVFPDQFEVEAFLTLNERRALTMSLSGATVTSAWFRRTWRGIDFGFVDGAQASCNHVAGYPLRVRLVRDGQVYRLIVRDQSVSQVVNTNGERFLSFKFDDDIYSRLHLVRLVPHGDNRQLAKLAELDETFATTAEGGLPPGWSGSPALSVRDVGGSNGLHAGDEGMHYVRKAIDIGTDFVVTLHAGIPDRKHLRLELEGTGNSPSLMLSFTSDESYRGDRVVAEMTGAANQQVAIGDVYNIAIQVEREGVIYRLHVNGETVVAQRMSADRRFSGLKLWLEGEPGSVRIYRVSVHPRGKQPPPDRIVARKPVIVEPPQAARQPDPAASDAIPPDANGPLTGRWRSGGGEIYLLLDYGETVGVRLVQATSIEVAQGLLSKRDDKNWRGTCRLIFNDDPARRVRSVDISMRAIDRVTLRVVTDRIIWDRSGNETSRGTDYGKWIRMQ